ncbi:hypothetical protein VP1G_08095 [Cytospora mali]|uniref:SRR1-like domain-containing protein n=1 Tax=Cytospora mali TaxID=578113 RepID=A0A194VAN9_CYTMA|nr:hypothetical protein VP1G_08095 [Valsa mali var. pyri (nom. inval.)]
MDALFIPPSETTEARILKDRIRAIYSSGVQFFKKSALENLMHQVDEIKTLIDNGQSIDGKAFLMEGIDGKVVQSRIPYYVEGLRPDHEGVLRRTEFTLEYRTYQQLIRAVDFGPSELAYCPLSIVYPLEDTDENEGLELTREVFHAGIKTWEASEGCKSLRSALETASIPGPITKIIAFANSTISKYDGPGRHRSIIQHALMLTLKKSLEARGSVGIECFAQDPIYTEVDKSVLQEVGITVLDDPRGFLEVDDQSIVLSFGANIPVRQIVSDLARPAILIWDTVINSEDEIIRSWLASWSPPRPWKTLEELEGQICDPESSRVQNMIENEYVEMVDFDEGFDTALRRTNFLDTLAKSGQSEVWITLE